MLALAGMARLVDVPLSQHTGGQRHGEYAPLPFMMENRLFKLGLGSDRTESLAAAEIVPSPHGAARSGACADSTPIIAFRVTSLRNRSTRQPSVPAGRMGTTR